MARNWFRTWSKTSARRPRLTLAPRLTSSRLGLEMLEARWLPSSSIPLNTTSWTAIGPSPILNGQNSGSLAVTGRVNDIATDPTNANIVYIAAAGGGLWKSTNATANNPTYTPLTDTISTAGGAVAVAKSNPNVVYFGTGDGDAGDSFGVGILKSTDGGATWTVIGQSQFAKRTIRRIVVSPTDANVLFVSVAAFANGDPGDHRGVWRSMDGGTTWDQITSVIPNTDSTAFYDLQLSPATPNTLYVCAGGIFGDPANGIYESTNALAATPTFTLLGGGLPSGINAGRFDLAIGGTAATANTLYASASDIGGNFGKLLGIFKSTDGGTTWTNLTNSTGMLDYMGGQGWYDQVISVDPTNANIVIVGGNVNVLRTTNGGSSWTNISTGSNNKGPHADDHAAAYDIAGNFLFGTDGGMFRYTPATNAWNTINGTATAANASGALNTGQFESIALNPTDPNLAVGGLQDNGTVRFNNNLAWSETDGGDGGDVAYDAGNSNTLYRVSPAASFGTANFVRKSTNGGVSWTSITNGIVDPNAANFYPPLVSDPGTAKRVLLGTDVLNVTTDGGTTWGRLPGDTFTFPGAIDAIGIGKSNSSTIYASASGQVFVTTNNGTTWTNRTPTGANGPFFGDIAVDPNNSNVAVVVNGTDSGNVHVWMTGDGGVTWTNVSSNLPAGLVASVALDPGPTAASADDIVYVGTNFGVYRADINGTYWTPAGTGLPSVLVNALALNATTGIVAAATYGRGVWEINTSALPGVVTGNVFDDLNINGVQDSGETGLAGWQVYADLNNNGVLDAGDVVATTDASGNYTLVLPASAGSYTIREVLQAGFAQTAPASGFYTVTLASDQVVTAQNFGDTQTFVLTGRKFNDLNGNGVEDPGEPGLAGFTIYDDLNGNGVFDAGEPSAVTDANGLFTVSVPTAGTYTLREVNQAGFTQLFPAAGFYSGTGTAGQTIGSLDFGNYDQATVTGTVFNDLNGNGAQDAGETGLAGVTVFDDLNGNGQLDAGEPSAITGAAGQYSIALPNPGPFTIQEIVPAGFVQTAPASLTYTGTPQSGQAISGLDFGDFATVSLSGVVYNDANGDGVHESNERGIAGATVNLISTTTGSVVAQTVTDGSGSYTFTGVGPGSFIVKQANKSSFTITSPASGQYLVTITSGSDVTGLDFGDQSNAIIVTAGDRGSLPIVTVKKASTGRTMFSIMAYDPRFRGGVRVAVADVNGDGVPDIITAAGPGGGPHVEVFDGRNGSLIRSFFAYTPAFTGGVWVAAADFNGDGYADILTGADAGGGPHVEVFSGKNGQVLASFFAYAPGFTGGVRVAAGNVEGPGKPDIVVAPGAGAVPVVEVFNGRTLRLIQSYYAFSPGFRGGVFVSVGDINGDGFADVTATAGVGGPAVVQTFSGRNGALLRSFAAFPTYSSSTSYYTGNAVWASGLRVSMVDANADGIADYLIAPGPGQSGMVRLIDGATLGTIFAEQAFDPSYLGGVFVAGG